MIIIENVEISIQQVVRSHEFWTKELNKYERSLERREVYMSKFTKLLKNSENFLKDTLRDKEEIEIILLPLLEKYKIIKEKETKAIKVRNEMRGGLNNGQTDLDRQKNNKKCALEKIKILNKTLKRKGRFQIWKRKPKLQKLVRE